MVTVWGARHRVGPGSRSYIVPTTTFDGPAPLCTCAGACGVSGLSPTAVLNGILMRKRASDGGTDCERDDAYGHNLIGVAGADGT